LECDLAGCSSHGNYPQSYKLLHDTFHHYLSGETEFFPKETGLVHVSGLLPGKTKAATTDEDRILVTKDDISSSTTALSDDANTCLKPWF